MSTTQRSIGASPVVAHVASTHPAPPPEVRKVTVIVPLFEPIEGVPIAGP